MAGFAARLESLNTLADASPGFVWRYQTDAGDATEVRVFDDELILFNLSVWEFVERLEDYVYRRNHAEAGHIPSVEEAKERFDVLWRDGPGAFAFTFRERFPAPAA